MKARRFWYVRPARSVALGIVSAVIAVAGAGLIWAGSVAARTGSWPQPLQGWLDRGAELTWSDPWTWGVSIAVMLVGLVVLVCALLPGRRDTVVIEGDAPESGRELVLSLRAVESLVGGSLERLDGVSRARVRFTGKQVRARVLTPVRGTSGIREAAERRVGVALEAIPLRDRPRVDVRVTVTGEH